MKRFKVTIEGTTPLLMHAFTDAAQIEATEATRASLQGDRGNPQEQAEGALYKDEAGNIVIPQPNLLRCLIDAGKYFKAGRGKVSTQKTSLIPACVDIPGAVIPLQHKQPWTVDTRPVRIPATGGRILRHRPCFDDWLLNFELEIDTDILTAKVIRDILDAAGKRVGLGDFRPDCKGPFDKFVVTQWKEQRSAAPQALAAD